MLCQKPYHMVENYMLLSQGTIAKHIYTDRTIYLVCMHMRKMEIRNTRIHRAAYIPFI